ncbi:MAG: PBSX family phage terminase large subunit [Methanoregula sp.]
MLQPLTGKALQSYCEADARLNIWEGSVSSSKTVTTFFAWVDFVINGPPGELVMIGKTERTLKRNVIDPLITMYGARNISTVGMGKGEIHIFGRRVYLVGANDERSEQKIRGASFVGAYCDEITLYPESFWIMLLSRLRSPGARLYGTTNPDGPFHWLKVNYLDKGLAHLKKWHFTLDDNPYLDPEYVKALKQEYTGIWYKRFILGLWCIAQGAVYDMWDEARHVIKELPAEGFDWFYTVIDYGTANPCAFLYNGVKDGKVTCIKEWYYDGRNSQRQKTDMDIYYDLHAFLRGIQNRYTILDPSALSLKTQLRKEEVCRECRGTGKINGDKCEACGGKGKLAAFTNLKDCDNSVLDGIRTLSSFLQNGRYQVHESCKNHRMEFGAYTWNPKAQARGEDEPMKVNDHTMDGARYGVQTLFGKAAGKVRATGRTIGGRT